MMANDRSNPPKTFYLSLSETVIPNAPRRFKKFEGIKQNKSKNKQNQNTPMECVISTDLFEQ